ncbi:MAG: glycosyltransferase family 4 protein [Cyanobacteria bacterium P01_D01_bin.105]
MRIAYLTGEYPRVTDTFIQREVAALRQYGKADGTTVETFSVRYPKAADALSEQQKEERDRTSYLLPPRPLEALKAHIALLSQAPHQYIEAISLAWKTRQLGVRGTVYQLIYFIEAGILARRLHAKGITHLHNHFGDSSCTVAMLTSALGNIDYSFTLHGPGIFFEPRRWHLTEKISRAKFVSCISYFCRSQAMIFAPWTSWSNLHIVHCGVEPALFAQAENSQNTHTQNTHTQSIHTQSTGQRLLYVGRLAAAKGLPMLLQSLTTLKLERPNIQLTVVGDGEDRSALEEQAQQLNLEGNVTFVGYQSPNAVREYLQASDVFVMSSFAEGVPVVLMEAMMAGLPVVATQIAGVSELVEDGVNGFLVPPSNAEALTGRIAALLADEELRSQFGAQGRLKVSQEFNIRHEAKKLYGLITSEMASASADSASTDSASADSTSTDSDRIPIGQY